MSMDKIEQKLNDALKYINNQRQQLQAIRDRLTRLETTLELVVGDEWGMWLYRNRGERMDPTVPIFDSERAAFHLARYQFAQAYASGLVVADIACGTGYGTSWLRRQGAAAQVIGVDLSAEAIRYAQAKHGGEGIEFQAGDCQALPFSNATFDLVVSFETIEHVTQEDAVIAEFARILRPGGRLICSTPNQWPLAIAPYHTREYNRQQFVDLVQTQFRLESLWNQNSGSSFPYNREQPAGIVPTTDLNHELAECFLAVAVKE